MLYANLEGDKHLPENGLRDLPVMWRTRDRQVRLSGPHLELRPAKRRSCLRGKAPAADRRGISMLLTFCIRSARHENAPEFPRITCHKNLVVPHSSRAATPPRFRRCGGLFSSAPILGAEA